MTTGEQIKKYRLAKGYTLEELGKIIGVSRQTVQRYESGVISNLPMDRLIKISKALDKPTSVFFQDIDDPENYSPKEIAEDVEKNNGKNFEKSVKKIAEKTVENIINQLDDFEDINLDENNIFENEEDAIEHISSEIADYIAYKIFTDLKKQKQNN